MTLQSGLATYSAYVDLQAAFDSLSRPAVWLLLTRCCIAEKLITLMLALTHTRYVCVLVTNRVSGVPLYQGCVIVTGMNYCLRDQRRNEWHHRHHATYVYRS